MLEAVINIWSKTNEDTARKIIKELNSRFGAYYNREIPDDVVFAGDNWAYLTHGHLIDGEDFVRPPFWWKSKRDYIPTRNLFQIVYDQVRKKEFAIIPLSKKRKQDIRDYLDRMISLNQARLKQANDDWDFVIFHRKRILLITTYPESSEN